MLYLFVGRPTNWIAQLASFVDLEAISRFHVAVSAVLDSATLIADDIGQCLRLMRNLYCLAIVSESAFTFDLLTLPRCSMVPSSVRHLAISAGKFNDCFAILERFDRLWSFKCYVDRSVAVAEQKELEKWLDENRRGSSCGHGYHSFYIWFGEERAISTSKRRKPDQESET